GETFLVAWLSRMFRNRIYFGVSALALFGIISSGCTGGDNTANNSNGQTSSTGSSSTGATATTRPTPPADGNTVSGDTILIGCATSISGANKPWGDDQKDGAQLAVDEVNKAGGINGKQVKMLVEDTASKPEPAKTAAEKL